MGWCLSFFFFLLQFSSSVSRSILLACHEGRGELGSRSKDWVGPFPWPYHPCTHEEEEKN